MGGGVKNPKKSKRNLRTAPKRTVGVKLKVEEFFLQARVKVCYFVPEMEKCITTLAKLLSPHELLQIVVISIAFNVESLRLLYIGIFQLVKT